MILLDKKSQQEQDYKDLKLAMLAGQPPIEKVHDLFPQYFPSGWEQEQALAKATDEHGNFDIDKVDDSKVDWKAEGITPDEDDEISRWIAERERGITSLQALDEGWK